MSRLQEATIPSGGFSIYTSFLEASRPRSDDLTVAIFHGAGQASSARHQSLSGLFADHGVSVVSLDFVGHGKTGGEVGQNSLALRTLHAEAAINHWTGKKTPLILCGFSMSAYTVLRVLPRFAGRVRGIGLLCPAAYSVEADEVNFGPEFTKALKETRKLVSSSPIYAEAARFEGRALLVTGAQDEVIPWDITQDYINSLRQNTKMARVEIIGGVGHKLSAWMSENAEFSAKAIEYLAGNK